MNCEKCLNLLDELIEGKLDAQTAEQINLHIFACKNCEAEYETLIGEKEIYSRFLFEIEPPKDLARNFQAKLETIEPEKTARVVSFDERFSKVFGVWNLKPLFSSLAVLLAVGFVYFLTKYNAPETETPVVSQLQTPRAAPPENLKNDLPDVSRREIAKVKTILPKAAKTKFAENERTVALKMPKVKKSSAREKTSPENPDLRQKDDLQIKEIRAFELATAKQIEKVEMLLRSFRNARYAADRDEYDIVYEKQQARKLLETNVHLRRQSEIYGTLMTNEMLSKVEPYLLEISNLNANPTDEEVLEIKQRVRNQNIIAGLQGF